MNLPVELIKYILKIKYYTFRKRYLEYKIVQTSTLEKIFANYYLGEIGYYNRSFIITIFYTPSYIFYGLDEQRGSQIVNRIKHFIK